mmetsp:Transcript_53127/g.78761  ORF Transcript_53127/g.78761 Transcript_53127/m.78761 type:complete len:515 (+) Transcript_53127:4918-6462(+)
MLVVYAEVVRLPALAAWIQRLVTTTRTLRCQAKTVLSPTLSTLAVDLAWQTKTAQAHAEAPPKLIPATCAVDMAPPVQRIIANLESWTVMGSAMEHVSTMTVVFAPATAAVALAAWTVPPATMIPPPRSQPTPAASTATFTIVIVRAKLTKTVTESVVALPKSTLATSAAVMGRRAPRISALTAHWIAMASVMARKWTMHAVSVVVTRALALGASVTLRAITTRMQFFLASTVRTLTMDTAVLECAQLDLTAIQNAEAAPSLTSVMCAVDLEAPARMTSAPLVLSTAPENVTVAGSLTSAACVRATLPPAPVAKLAMRAIMTHLQLSQTLTCAPSPRLPARHRRIVTETASGTWIHRTASTRSMIPATCMIFLMATSPAPGTPRLSHLGTGTAPALAVALPSSILAMSVAATAPLATRHSVPTALLTARALVMAVLRWIPATFAVDRAHRALATPVNSTVMEFVTETHTLMNAGFAEVTERRATLAFARQALLTAAALATAVRLSTCAMCAGAL